MKRFLIILGLTAIVWLGVSMAEPMEYSLRVRVTYTGYDSVRYAMVSADTSLMLRIKSDGYTAFLIGMLDEEPEVEVSVSGSGMQRAAGMESLYTAVRESMVGIKDVSSGMDSLRVTLAERKHKTFKPTLDEVSFEFDEQYALYGQPRITPSEVTLYGPEEALASITALPVAKTTVSGIHASGSYTMKLEPVWRQAGDVHTSCTEVSVYVPVEAYVEREYRVPIQVADADTSVTVHIYPPEATLHVWVAQRDLYREPEFTVTVNYSDILANGSRIVPQLTEFPSYVRPRGMEPAEVQCVIIK